MVNVADTSHQQEVALVRNEVQRARETVINGIAGTSGLCRKVVALANQVNGFVALSEFETQQAPLVGEQFLTIIAEVADVGVESILICGHKCLMVQAAPKAQREEAGRLCPLVHITASIGDRLSRNVLPLVNLVCALCFFGGRLFLPAHFI